MARSSASSSSSSRPRLRSSIPDGGRNGSNRNQATAANGTLRPDGVPREGVRPQDLRGLDVDPRSAPADDGRGLVERLGVIGLDDLEPVLFASLVLEAPLLLIGPHGTAKSHLLSRIAEALGLEFRHYNASLLNYDDLVGYPLPDDDGGLRFVETPASVWPAEAVFLDEISRCRIDMQNRLFSLVHERRVQGIAVPRLRFRWAAMNPPADREDPDATQYLGSESLDPALADRFTFLVSVPDWRAFTPNQRCRLIEIRDVPVDADTASAWRATVAAIEARIPEVESSLGEDFGIWVRVVAEQLAKAGIRLSGRRLAALRRAVVAVHAAGTVLDGVAPMPRDSAWTTLRHAMPGIVSESGVDLAKVLAAHHEAWRLASLDDGDPAAILASETDPIRKAIRALELPVNRMTRSTLVADAIASADLGMREAFALFLIDHPAISEVNPAVVETIARYVCHARSPQGFEYPDHPKAVITPDEVAKALARRSRDIATDGQVRNVVQVMLRGQHIRTIDGVERVADAFLRGLDEFAEVRSRLEVDLGSTPTDADGRGGEVSR